MRRLVTATLAAAASVALVGGAAVATHAVTGPSSDPTGHGSHVAGPAVATTNATPQATFSPNPDATTFVAISPCRAVNTVVKGGPIKKGKSRSFQIRGSASFAGQGGSASGCGIPADATAVAATITTLHQTGSGTIKALPAGSTGGAALAESYTKNTQTTSGVTLPLGPTGQAKDVTLQSGGANTDVIVDVTGYYTVRVHLIILADGTFWYGNTGDVTSLIHDPGSGRYTLTFARSLDGCNVLTSGNGNSSVQVSAIWGGSTLTVTTGILSGGNITSQDESFQMFVVC
jgi:hypothetical protein